MSRKHRTGQSGKGRPTPRRGATGVRSRPTPTRSRSSGRSSAKGPVYRQRRYPPLPLTWKVLLAALWLGGLVATLLLVEPWPARIGVMIAVTFVLPLAVVLLRDPSRRRR